MLAELKSKSQVTIPKDIVNSLGLSQGDQFEVREEGGKIILIPVAVYPERLIENLKDEIEEVKLAINRGDQPLFDSIDDLFDELEK